MPPASPAVSTPYSPSSTSGAISSSSSPYAQISPLPFSTTSEDLVTQDSTAQYSTTQNSESVSPPPPPPPPGNLATTHPMTTRAKDGIFKPKIYDATKHPLTNDDDFEPLTYSQASYLPQWRTPMDNEYYALLKNGTFSIVPPPPGKNIIGNKWVYRIKRKPDGTIDRRKARLVAKGFSQKEGVDYQETFSPVVKPCTIRTIISLALAKNWPLHQ